MPTIDLDDAGVVPSVFEHTAIELALTPAAGTHPVLLIDSRPLEPFLRPGDPRWYWPWNSGSAVGLHELTLIRGTGSAPQKQLLRVVPHKIDQQQYEELLADLEAVARRLAQALGGSALEGIVAQPSNTPPSALEQYELLAPQIDRFAAAVDQISRNPATMLVAHREQQPLEQWRGPPANPAPDLLQGGLIEAPPDAVPTLQAHLHPAGGLLPQHLPATGSFAGYDCYANRLVRRVIEILIDRFSHIVAYADQLTAQATTARVLQSTEIAATSRRILQRLRGLAALPFLQHVGPLSSFHGAGQPIRQRHDYRTVYHMWRLLRTRPLLSFDLTGITVPIADLPLLYERWCMLVVVATLAELAETVVEQQVIRVERNSETQRIGVCLAERTPLLIFTCGERRFTVSYQPRYGPAASPHTEVYALDRQVHIPDLAIEVHAPTLPTSVLLLDAKYRLAADGRQVPRDALADAYTYLGAIGHGATRATLGAVLLYPGTASAQRYASGVGTIPLAPGKTDQIRPELAAWLGIQHT